MANFATQKSLGKLIGKVTAVGRNSLTISGTESFANGDGLCYYDADGRLQGFLVNGVQDRTVTPNQMPDIKVGTTLWRNQDQRFEKLLQGKSAERKIGVEMLFCATPDGFALRLTAEEDDAAGDETAAEDAVQLLVLHVDARVVGGADVAETQHAGGLGERFVATAIVDETQGRYFLPAGTLNQLRREAVEQLVALRIAHHRPADCPRSDSGVPYPTPTLDYQANVINDKAEAFYRRHGAKEIERGLEQTEDYDGKALMTTKYCLRYELGCCLQGKNSSKPQLDIKPTATLLLRNNDRRFRLQFDCRNCQMLIYKENFIM